ncbi:MAG TPA: chloride channel protein [Steroidobacteraceae bacterium]|nr:chloride channel protein [Steroidobacteraceae bacterium]
MATGVGAGLSGAILMALLSLVQHRAWPGPHILDAAIHTDAWHHVGILLGAGLLTGVGQVVLRKLSSGNSIDITEAITNFAGRLPPLRTLGSAVLSVSVVGMGASLGREGAPKQAGAVIANALADGCALSDEQRRLLVACGAGAGMAAAYGVPLGGALFAVEVLRGVLALRLILPALLASAAAAGIAWWTTVLLNEPTYAIPSYALSPSVVGWSVAAGPIIGVVSVGFIRVIAWADRHKPTGTRRLIAPVVALGLLGAASIAFPQLLGNGKDIAELAFSGQVTPVLSWTLFVLKPLAVVMCLGSGVPGGLFTPSLATGALLGGALGAAWSSIWPGAPPGLCAIVGSAAVLAATTHGPVSSIVLVMELTGRDRSFILPMIIAVVLATVVARSIDPRSIYDARFSDREVSDVLLARKPAAR